MFGILGLNGLSPLCEILLFIVFDTRLLNLLGVDRLGLVVAVHGVGGLS